MGCRPLCFMFKNALSFIYCTVQNTKEIIWLKRCYLLIKTRRSILKWYGSTTYLRQLSSSNNSLAPKISVKVFSTAYWLMTLSKQNNKLNSPSTIDKPTTIHLCILNDCKKTCFSSTAPIRNFYVTKHYTKPWFGNLAAQLFLNRISAPSSLNLQIGIASIVRNRVSKNRCEI